METETTAIADEAEKGCGTNRPVLQLERYWLDNPERFDYFNNRSREQFAEHFQQLIHRLNLNKADATVLWGCLAQFNYFVFKDKFAPGKKDT